MRAALFAIALIAYLNSFSLDLAFDGRRMVRDDPRIRAVSAANLRLILKKDYWYPANSDRLYRPLTTASYLLNYSILGNADRAPGYHVLNFLLHAVNVWLVFALGQHLFNRAGPAFFAAALWAVHPIGTEVVTNIAGRADLLATTALLGGLLVYIRMDALPAARRQNAFLDLFAIALAGMFAKETGVLLVGLMLLWDLTFGLTSDRAAIRTRLPAYAAAIAPLPIFLMARYLIFSKAPWTTIPFVDNPLVGAGFWTGRFTAIKILGLDLKLLFWPAGLTFDRSYNQIPLAGPSDPWAWVSLTIIAALLTLAIVRYRRDPLLFWAAGFLGIALLPTANLLILIGSIMAERFLYLPAIGFAIAITALVYRFAGDRVAAGILVCAIVICTALTLMRNPAWQDDYSLAVAGVQAAPRSFRAHRLLAGMLHRRDPVHNLDAAIHEEEVAWSILQTAPVDGIDQQCPIALGFYYRLKGDASGGPGSPEGRAWYEKSVAILERGMQSSRLMQQEFDDAQAAHGRPLGPRGGFEGLYINLGRTQATLGRHEDAITNLRYARDVNPDDVAIYDGLATIYAAQGNLAAAAIVLNQKAAVFGFSPATLTSLRNIYGRLPGGDCAVVQDAAGSRLNPACPRVKSDLCQAWSELAQVFNTARQPERASALGALAQQNGCPAALAAR